MIGGIQALRAKGTTAGHLRSLQGSLRGFKENSNPADPNLIEKAAKGHSAPLLLCLYLMVGLFYYCCELLDDRKIRFVESWRTLEDREDPPVAEADLASIFVEV